MKSYKEIDKVPVWGEPLDNAVKQIVNCSRDAEHTALMADHHLGYAMPIGGVAAYRNKVSPSGVGYDISCGNKAVLLDASADFVRSKIAEIMDEIFHTLSFGIGRKNNEAVTHPLFANDPAWDIEVANRLRSLAQSQLGTIGSGNYYVDLFVDEQERIWCGVHFGSRGLGHKLATHFIKAGGGKEGIDVDPVLLSTESQLGQEYVACMKLAGRYAYAGRNWVCEKVASLLHCNILDEIHNHHNFAWKEQHFGQKMWVIRKGATPAFPGQRGFVGGSMGDISVIIEGVESEESVHALYSTVHGAGRVMSRTAAAGKRRWKRARRAGTKKSSPLKKGAISREMMMQWVSEAGVELRGAGTDESPHCYKRLPTVLKYHANTINIVHTLKPIGVAMAGQEEYDPFRD